MVQIEVRCVSFVLGIGGVVFQCCQQQIMMLRYLLDTLTLHLFLSPLSLPPSLPLSLSLGLLLNRRGTSLLERPSRSFRQSLNE